ncbi:malto-oligosyltrehalose trehalohydrolase [Sulfitobacter sp. D35]|uniref:malto-oligosyltrehalose trehalohydrolase n=1 Tax=Sulfitobacter sp. D35 TaxID=3083252 RepID=UPI00296E6AC1|nr:malto-oligosyltrehalose trehalohydrolase [Sulfitobacter sp. D35]MDW4499750.1 malto-oligosyltrehalose trehalohydrolase [Sulfitobacter sp. D35]
MIDVTAWKAPEYNWGARPVGENAWRFRLWAPGAAKVSLRLPGRDHPMVRVGQGWFECECGAAEGDAYGFVLPDGMIVPDPAARRQSGGVHDMSVLVAPPGSDPREGWAGRAWHEAVIYELHVGTFTDAGTFRAAIDRLDHVAACGFTAIEIMPVGAFPGDRGWGYDVVLPYAVHGAYGSPEDLRALVQAAQARGLMVFLDVVYNHFGPDGNYLSVYAPDFFDPKRQTPWGQAIAYDRAPVRRFFTENALCWLVEYGFDGLRLDAIDHVRDPHSETEFLLELIAEIRAVLPDRHVHTMTEDNRNVTHLHERDRCRVTRHTAEWNDDLHNAAHVIATDESEGYYADFAQDPWRLYSRALAEGYAYQGEPTLVDGRPRGEVSAHLPPDVFVDFLQNHDQVGNRAFGERLSALTSADMLEALTAALLLSPHVPLIFMGEEFAAVTPFLFFADYDGDLGQAVTEGRRREFAEFSAFASGGTSHIPDPVARSTFEASRLDWSEAAKSPGQERIAFIQDLLALRARHVVPHIPDAGPNAGTVLQAEAGAVAVDWRLGDARLQLRARLAENAPDPVQPGSGQLLIRAGAGEGQIPVSEVWIDLEKAS